MIDTSITLLGKNIGVFDLSAIRERFSGECVAETKQMLFLRTPSGVRMAPKQTSLFQVEGNGRVDGRTILGRPVDRLIRS